MLKKISFTLIFLLLSACGYHLRGNVELPAGMEKIYLEGASGMLEREIRKAIKPSHGKLVRTATDAGIVIKFAREEMNARVTSINTAGRANQFQLIYQLLFSIYEPTGKLILADQEVNIKREYFNDQTDILGKSNEENVIREEMYQQAVSSIVYRINLATESSVKNK